MKFLVTPELAKLIKTLRVHNGMSAKELAEHMGKSPSYVSKLEGGDVRFIEQDNLTEVLSFTAGGRDFYEETLPAAVKLLQGTMDGSRLVDQVWLMQYDVVERPVRVPGDMARDIAANLDKMGASPADLVELVNANIDSQMSPSFPANEMIAVDYDGKRRMLARVEIAQDTVDQVLSTRDFVVGYFMLYNIVHALFRMQHFPGVQTKLPPDDAAKVLRCAAAYMGRWGIHSLIGYSHFVSSDEFIAYQRPLATSEAGVVERIAAQLKEIAAHDSLHAINQLNTFHETIDWDPAFALKVMGIPFALLDDLSFTNKRKLLDEIQALVDRYDRMSDFERKMENY